MGKKLADPKKCTRCGEHKPRADFYPHAVAKNGVSALVRYVIHRSFFKKQFTT